MIRDEIRNQGWNIIKSQDRKRGRSGVDQDVDILCERNHETVLIECKRIDSTKSITLGEVHDLFARMYDLEVKKGVVVTTSAHVVKEADMFSKYYGIRILPIAEFLARTLENLI
jgi:Holliday junction resolvase